MNEQAWGPSRRDPRPGEQALIVQLAHSCGRNLARVRYSHYNSLWTRDSLVVFPNINVRQETYRPRELGISQMHVSRLLSRLMLKLRSIIGTPAELAAAS